MRTPEAAARAFRRFSRQVHAVSPTADRLGIDRFGGLYPVQVEGAAAALDDVVAVYGDVVRDRGAGDLGRAADQCVSVSFP